MIRILIASAWGVGLAMIVSFLRYEDDFVVVGRVYYFVMGLWGWLRSVMRILG
jgi:hypothetical protein